MWQASLGGQLTGVCWHVLLAQVSVVQALLSPQSVSAVQQPAIGARPQVPSAQMAGLQVVPGQSAGAQHC